MWNFTSSGSLAGPAPKLITEVENALFSDITVLCYTKEEFYAQARANHCWMADSTPPPATPPSTHGLQPD